MKLILFVGKTEYAHLFIIPKRFMPFGDPRHSLWGHYVWIPQWNWIWRPSKLYGWAIYCSEKCMWNWIFAIHGELRWNGTSVCVQNDTIVYQGGIRSALNPAESIARVCRSVECCCFAPNIPNMSFETFLDRTAHPSTLQNHHKIEYSCQMKLDTFVARAFVILDWRKGDSDCQPGPIIKPNTRHFLKLIVFYWYFVRMNSWLMLRMRGDVTRESNHGLLLWCPSGRGLKWL